MLQTGWLPLNSLCKNALPQRKWYREKRTVSVLWWKCTVITCSSSNYHHEAALHQKMTVSSVSLSLYSRPTKSQRSPNFWNTGLAIPCPLRGIGSLALHCPLRGISTVWRYPAHCGDQQSSATLPTEGDQYSLAIPCPLQRTNTIVPVKLTANQTIHKFPTLFAMLSKARHLTLSCLTPYQFI